MLNVPSVVAMSFCDFDDYLHRNFLTFYPTNQNLQLRQNGIFVCQVNLWNTNCGQAAAFDLDWRMDWWMQPSLNSWLYSDIVTYVFLNCWPRVRSNLFVSPLNSNNVLPIFYVDFTYCVHFEMWNINCRKLNADDIAVTKVILQT